MEFRNVSLQPGQKTDVQPILPGVPTAGESSGVGSRVNWGSAEQAAAVAEIVRLGGKVTVDESRPDKPVTSVDLAKTRVTDAGREHLKGLTQLQWLNLEETRVTDVGLQHLKRLTQLKKLDLMGTPVTAAGIKGLQNALPNCKIAH